MPGNQELLVVFSEESCGVAYVQQRIQNQMDEWRTENPKAQIVETQVTASGFSHGSTIRHMITILVRYKNS